MPSDERVQRALEALGPARHAFRAAVAAAHDQVCAYLATHGALERDRRDESLRELGSFAAGRIDVARFADLASEARVLPPPAEAIVRQCADVLQDVLERRDLLHTVVVVPGGDMRAAVDAALAEAGRAFGAVLVFQAVRTGVYCTEQHQPLLRAFPYARWNRAERQLGVPLVIRATGADLRADALAEYLDGRQRFVVTVEEPCTPAPLVRLATPSVLAMQVAADAELARMTSFDGPAVAAIVPDSAVRFVNDPRETPRFTVQHVPTGTPARAIGRWSVWQQREQLAQLDWLARPAAMPAAPAVPATQAGSPTPAAAAPAAPASAPPAATSDAAAVESLAGWLLAQAGFTATGQEAGGSA